MRITSVRRAGLALAAALAVAFSGLTVAPAQALAPNLNPDNRLGDVTLDVTSGAISWAGGPQRLTTETGCPEGFRRSSRVFLIWPDGTWVTSASQFAAAPFAAATEGSGLDGQAIDRRNVSALTYQRWASKWAAGGAGGIPASSFNGHSGVATYVVTCDPGAAPDGTLPTNASGVGDSKYFSVDIRIDWNDAGAGTWEVADGGGPVEKVDTTTTLTGAAQNDGSVRLTAGVRPQAATGSVTFKRGDGSTIVVENVSGGTASTVVGGLEPDNEYTFTAEYAGDTLHNASASGTLTVTTVAEPLPPQKAETDVTVTIPAAAGSLQLTVAPGGVSLGTAELDGTEFVAEGELAEVKVTDNREPRNGWSLNGEASAFTTSGGAGATIPASALGWTPELAGGPGQVGETVAPGVGLSAPRSLASVQPGASTAVTTVGAALTLRAPQDTPEGAYTSTLTLTLI